MEMTGQLAEFVQNFAVSDGFFPTDVPNLFVMKSGIETRPQCMLYHPALCLIIQGTKEMSIGQSRNTFHEGQLLVTSKHVPTLVNIRQASASRPFLGIGLELDLAAMRDVIEHLPEQTGNSIDDTFELFADDTSQPILDCILRLVSAAKRPYALPILHASITREIYYWLLTGPNGAGIARQISVSDPAQRIAGVIKVLRETFAEPIRIDQLADRANMSPSSFFQHFKSVTSMTPLQFQKQLRLLEARRLLVTAKASVAQAADRVGYESASQFSREYSRMFGLPPARDTAYFYQAGSGRPGN